MFVPLYDKNSLTDIHFQFVTLFLIAVNVAVFVFYQSGLVFPVDMATMAEFAVIPTQLLQEIGVAVSNDVLLPGPAAASGLEEELTLVTYMFLHGGWMHLFGNMLFLWVFGDNVEDAMGHIRFLIFYLICGVFAGFTHAYMVPDSDLPLVGASGAVAGVIAAYLMLHPRVQVWVLVMWRYPIPVSAGLALGFWVVLQIFMVVSQTEGNTAWWAHIGGLFAGAILVLFMRRPGVPLFDRTPVQTS